MGTMLKELSSEKEMGSMLKSDVPVLYKPYDHKLLMEFNLFDTT